MDVFHIHPGTRYHSVRMMVLLYYGAPWSDDLTTKVCLIGEPALHGEEVEDDVALLDELEVEVGPEDVVHKFALQDPLGQLHY